MKGKLSSSSPGIGRSVLVLREATIKNETKLYRSILLYNITVRTHLSYLRLCARFIFHVVSKSSDMTWGCHLRKTLHERFSACFEACKRETKEEGIFETTSYLRYDCAFALSWGILALRTMHSGSTFSSSFFGLMH